MRELRALMHDYGLKWDTVLQQRPDLNLPPGTSAEAVDTILSLFTALLVRLGRRCGQRPRIHWAGAKAILKDPLFSGGDKLVRVNQCFFHVDHGSLLFWRLVLRPYLIARYKPDAEKTGWARQFV